MRTLALALALFVVGAATAVAVPGLTRSQAVSLAKASNLTPDDMPGFDASPPSHNSGSAQENRQLARCVGTTVTRPLADEDSDDFQQTTSDMFLQVSSNVTVEKSAKSLRNDLKLLKTKRAQGCIVKLFKKDAASPGTKIVSAKASLLRPAVKDGVGLRIKAIVETGGARVLSYSDFLFRQIGQVEASVLAVWVPGAPDRARENDLLDIVSSRVSTNLSAAG